MTHLAKTITDNLERARQDQGLSTRHLAHIAGMAQKTVHSCVNATHVPKVDTVDGVATAMLVSPAAMTIENVPMDLLVGFQADSLLKHFAKLPKDKRWTVIELVKQLAEMEGK